MTHSQKVGARVKELREGRGLTQTELGKNLELGKGAISAIELGKTKLNTDQLSILTALFQVSSSYIMCEEINSPHMDIQNHPFVLELRQEIEGLRITLNNILKNLGGNLGKSKLTRKTAGNRVISYARKFPFRVPAPHVYSAIG